jgi:hypothetical protein
LEHGWKGECFSEDEEEDGEGWIENFINSSLFCYYIHIYFCTNILFCFLQQLEKEIAADEKVQREQDKHEEENARDDGVGDHPF